MENIPNTDPEKDSPKKEIVSPLKGAFDSYKKDKKPSNNTDPNKPKTEAKVNPLASVFKSMSKFNETNTPKQEFDSSISFNTKEYKGYVNYMNPNANLGKERALTQTTEEKVQRTVSNLLPNIAVGLIESVGNIGAVLGNTIGTNTTFSNDLTRWAEKSKNVFGEAYQEAPDETFAVNDVAWWLNHGSGLVESIGQFALVGAGAARVFGAVAKGIARLGASQKATQAGAQIMTSGTLASIEGAMTATDVWRNAIQKGINANRDMKEVRQEAAKAAATTFQLSTAMVTALNMTSVGAFFKPVGKSSTATAMNIRRKAGESKEAFKKRLIERAKYDPSLRRTIKNYGLEAGQEGFEEQVNLIAEKEGEKSYDNLSGSYLSLDSQEETLNRTIGNMLSDEGLLNFMLGAAGGIGQTAITSNIPIHKKYNEEGKVKYLSSRQIEVLEKTNTVNKFGEQIINDLEKVYKLTSKLKEVQNRKIESDDADQREVLEWNKKQEIEKIKQDIFNVRAVRSVKSGVVEPLIGELTRIAETSNVKGYVDLELDKEIKETEKALTDVSNKIQRLTNNPTSPQGENSGTSSELAIELNALLEQEAKLKKEFKERLKIKEENGQKTEAEYLGLSEGENDFDYKTKALRAIQDIKELDAKWQTIQSKYSSDQEIQANLPDYMFELEHQKIILNNSKNDIDSEISSIKTSLKEKREAELNNDLYIDYETYEDHRLTVEERQNRLEENQSILQSIQNIKNNKGTNEDFEKVKKAYERTQILPTSNNVDVLEELAKKLKESSEEAYNTIEELQESVKEIKERYKEDTGKDIEKALSQQLTEEAYLKELIAAKETLKERQKNNNKNLLQMSGKEERQKFIIGVAKAREQNIKRLKAEKKAKRLDNRIKAYAKAKKLQYQEVKEKVIKSGEGFLNDGGALAEEILGKDEVDSIKSKTNSLKQQAKKVALSLLTKGKQLTKEVKDYFSEKELKEVIKDAKELGKSLPQKAKDEADVALNTKKGKEIKEKRSIKNTIKEELEGIDTSVTYRGNSIFSYDVIYSVTITLKADGTKQYTLAIVDKNTGEDNLKSSPVVTEETDEEILSKYFISKSYDVYDPLDDVEESVFKVIEEEEEGQVYEDISEALIATAAKTINKAQGNAVILKDDAKKAATSLFNTLQKVRKKGGSILNQKLKSDALSDNPWENYIKRVEQASDRDQLRDNLNQNAKEVFEDINNIYRDLDYLIETLSPKSIEDFLITLGRANNGFMKQKVVDNLNEFISLYLANPRTEETIASIDPKKVINTVLSSLVGDTFVPRPKKVKTYPEPNNRSIIKQALDSLFSPDSNASLLGLSQNGLFEENGNKKISANTIANQTVPFRFIEKLNPQTGRYEITRRLTSNPSTAKEVQTERVTEGTKLEFIVDEDYNGFIYDEEGSKITVGKLKDRYGVPENENVWKYLKQNNREYYESKVPIKIVANGEVIGYVHDLDWINRDDEITNIVSTIFIEGQAIDNKAIQEANIMNIRAKIISNFDKGLVTKGKVQSKSIGFLNIDAEEKYSPIKENIKKLDNVEFSIVKEGQYFTSTKTVSTKKTPFDVPTEYDEGGLFIFYPSSNDKKIGVREKVLLPKLSSVKNKNGSLVDTTLLLLKDMYKNKNYSEVKDIIENYLFVGNATQEELNTISSGVRLGITKQGLIFFGEAGGQLQVVKNSQEFLENLDNIETILSNMYVNANLSKLSSGSSTIINFPYIGKNSNILYKRMEYKEFLSSVGKNMTKGIKDGSNEVYFNNPVISYNLNKGVKIIKPDIDSSSAPKDSKDNDNYDPFEGLGDSLMSNALSENEHNNIKSNLNNNC